MLIGPIEIGKWRADSSNDLAASALISSANLAGLWASMGPELEGLLVCYYFSMQKIFLVLLINKHAAKK